MKVKYSMYPFLEEIYHQVWHKNQCLLNLKKADLQDDKGHTPKFLLENFEQSIFLKGFFTRKTINWDMIGLNPFFFLHKAHLTTGGFTMIMRIIEKKWTIHRKERLRKVNFLPDILSLMSNSVPGVWNNYPVIYRIKWCDIEFRQENLWSDESGFWTYLLWDSIVTVIKY